jgi:hypothetical protein
VQLGVKPDAFNPTLGAGDLVRVRLERTPSTGGSSLHNYLYEVDRISKSITGQVLLELTHFPVDANLASVVAQEVAVAVGGGLLLPTGLTGITCDVNSSSDTSVPAETFTDDPFSDYGIGLDAFVEPMLEDFPVSNPNQFIILPLQFTSDGDIDARGWRYADPTGDLRWWYCCLLCSRSISARRESARHYSNHHLYNGSK